MHILADFGLGYVKCYNIKQILRADEGVAIVRGVSISFLIIIFVLFSSAG